MRFITVIPTQEITSTSTSRVSTEYIPGRSTVSYVTSDLVHNTGYATSNSSANGIEFESKSQSSSLNDAVISKYENYFVEICIHKYSFVL